MDVYSADLLGELEAIAESRLGPRSAPVTEILRAAQPSEAGLMDAIEKIRVARVPFVDPLVISYVAEEMESSVAARSSRPAPRYSLAASRLEVATSSDPSWLAWAPAGCAVVPVMLACLALAVLSSVRSG